MIDLVADIRVPAILLVWCAYIIAGLCFFGLVCKNFHDNVFQTIGLMGLILWALGRADTLGDRESLTMDQVLAWQAWQTLSKADTVSFYQVLGTFSMVLYGIGTAWKVWRHRKSNTNPNGVTT